VTAARDHRDFLHDMAMACRSIIRFAKGMTLDASLADEKTRYTVMRSCQNLSEVDCAAFPARLVVADPGLVGMAGHHLGYSQAVAEAAIERDLPALILANSSCAVPIPGCAVPCLSTFHTPDLPGGGSGRFRRIAYYGASLLPSTAARRVAQILRSGRRIVRRRSGFSDTLGRELAEALAAAGGGARDLVLLHTVSATQLYSLPFGLPGDAIGILAVVLRRTPDEMELADGAPVPIAQVLDRLASHFGERLRLCTDTEPLSGMYRTLARQPVRTVPIPVVVPPIASPAPASGLPHVVFAGGARVEKGYDLLPPLVTALRGRARFTIHSGPVDRAADPLVQQAHRKLLALVDEDVVLLTTELEPPHYLALLASADLLLLPYDAQVYGPRSSGILAEARALGIPAVVPAGTWMAEAAGPSRDIIFADRSRLLETMERTLAVLPELKAAWHDRAASWRRDHCPEALLDALMAT